MKNRGKIQKLEGGLQEETYSSVPMLQTEQAGSRVTAPLGFYRFLASTTCGQRKRFYFSEFSLYFFLRYSFWKFLFPIVKITKVTCQHSSTDYTTLPSSLTNQSILIDHNLNYILRLDIILFDVSLLCSWADSARTDSKFEFFFNYLKRPNDEYLWNVNNGEMSEMPTIKNEKRGISIGSRKRWRKFAKPLNRKRGMNHWWIQFN